MTNCNPNLECGVIYIATGTKCVGEAVTSVHSLKRTNPNLSATLFTDVNGDFQDFDRVLTIESPTHTSLDKVVNIGRSPYKKTLYLDSDTHITDDITDIFLLLDKFEFAGMIEISRGYWYRHLTNLPDSFPEINSGVLAFRQCPAVDLLLTDWRRCYQESVCWQKTPGLTKRVWDQPGLREALYNSVDLRISSLPSEYNALQLTGTFVWGKAKILHSRHRPEDFAASINRHPNKTRVYLQQIGTYIGWANMTLGELLTFAFRANAVVAKGLLKKLTATAKKSVPGRNRSKAKLIPAKESLPTEAP